jgi:hypothetical protein
MAVTIIANVKLTLLFFMCVYFNCLFNAKYIQPNIGLVNVTFYFISQCLFKSTCYSIPCVAI